MRVESRSFWSVGGLVRRAGWLGAHPSAAGRGWWVLWCGWGFLWLGGFCDLGLAGGVQQWLVGLEARCLFDLRWGGNGTGAVVAVGGGWVAALWRWRSWDFFVFVFAGVNLLNALNICSAGELRAEPRAMRLVNHPFRLDSQRLLSYLTSMRVLTLAVTPAISTTFWNTIYFYAASATAGNLSYDCARGRHRTVSAAASRRHVDASLGLFARKGPRSLRDLAEKRALSLIQRINHK